MFRGLVVLFLAAPMVTASSRMDLESQFAQAKIAQNLLRSDVKHWQTEKNTLEELLDGRDTISAKASEKFQGQLNHAKKQLGLAEAALEVQNLELAKMETAVKMDGQQAAHLADSPLWAPDHEVPVLEMKQEGKQETTLATTRRRRKVDHDEEDLKPKGPCSLTMKSADSDKEKGTCTYGVSYGCVDNRTMWVDAGCRGSFDCNGGHELCESISYKYETCRCDAPDFMNQDPAVKAMVGANSAESMVKEWAYQAKKAQRDWAKSSKKAQDLWATANDQAMQKMNSKVSNLLSKSKQLSQEEQSLKQAETEDEEPVELVKCKVQCQRFGMKQMGPQFENLRTVGECVNKCGEVYAQKKE